MPKRSRKPTDLNSLAAAIVGEATIEKAAAPKKNRAAAALGRKGGKKGGPARAAALTPEERSAIAKKAATARWGAPNIGLLGDRKESR